MIDDEADLEELGVGREDWFDLMALVRHLRDAFDEAGGAGVVDAPPGDGEPIESSVGEEAEALDDSLYGVPSEFLW